MFGISAVRQYSGAWCTLLALSIPLVGVDGVSAQDAPVSLTAQESGTDALLQAVSPVHAGIVWVSGHSGVVVRTVDGGDTWTRIPAPAADSLQYRDIHGFSPSEAVILSAGTGPASRIYRTQDAGGTWELGYFMEAPTGFLDCMDFWDDRGFAYGDAIDGLPFILVTRDRGRSWERPSSEGLPEARTGEGGFAASGTCARTGEDGVGWIATGASGAARVLRTSDYGVTWDVVDAPVVTGDAAGLTTIDFHADGRTGAAFGGDLANMDGATGNAVGSDDGGASWHPTTSPSFLGPVYGSAFVPGNQSIVVVGPAGASHSPDGGRTWTTIDTSSYWAVGSAEEGATWMVGPEGRIVRVTIP